MQNKIYKGMDCFQVVIVFNQRAKLDKSYEWLTNTIINISSHKI